MKKFIAIIMAVLTAFSLLCFTGCSGSVDSASDLENVKAAGVIKVGMECAYAPFNWTQTDSSNGAVKIANAEGYANGYDVQIAQKIADALGVTLEIYAYDWEALIPAVESGNLDLIIAGMSPTAERKETIDFSENYYISNLVILVQKGSKYETATTLADFDGAKIAAQDGTFHCEALSQIPNVKSQIMDDFTILYSALSAGTIDGYVAEEPTAFSQTAINENLTYVKLINNSTGFTASEDDTAIAVGMRKGSSLATEINNVIKAVSDAARSELMSKMVMLSPADE